MSGQSHHISTARKIRVGDFQSAYDQAVAPGKGISVGFLHRLSYTPALFDADGYAVAQAVAAAGNLTLAGALATNGLGIADVARTVTVTSSNAGDTTQIATVYGSDIHGAAQVETLAFNGAATIQGVKAFKTVSRIAISAALTGNGSAGTGSKIGLPVYSRGGAGVACPDVIRMIFDGAVESGTVTAGATTSPATATSLDPKGVYASAGTFDGVKVLELLIVIQDLNSPFGVANYAG